MTKPTKKYIMRSYVPMQDSPTPVLRYLVAEHDTGKIMQMDLKCDEAEKIRDELNRSLATVNAAPPPRPDYPAQPPRLDNDHERIADRVMAVFEDDMGALTKIMVLAICIMRLEYAIRRTVRRAK